MKDSLLVMLKALPSDPSVAVHLYEQLFEADFLVIVQKGTQQDLNIVRFLTYETKDGKKELPIFTQKEFIIDFQNIDSEILHFQGQSLWQKLLKVVENDSKLYVAVDPGQKHGIRLALPMILGMISKYGMTMGI